MKASAATQISTLRLLASFSVHCKWEIDDSVSATVLQSMTERDVRAGTGNAFKKTAPACLNMQV